MYKPFHTTHVKRLELSEDLKTCIEDYLNAPHVNGRPFVDYRPDIGNHLFPDQGSSQKKEKNGLVSSHRTGLGIGRWRLRQILTQELTSFLG